MVVLAKIQSHSTTNELDLPLPVRSVDRKENHGRVVRRIVADEFLAQPVCCNGEVIRIDATGLPHLVDGTCIDEDVQLGERQRLLRREVPKADPPRSNVLQHPSNLGIRGTLIQVLRAGSQLQVGQALSLRQDPGIGLRAQQNGPPPRPGSAECRTVADFCGQDFGG